MPPLLALYLDGGRTAVSAVGRITAERFFAICAGNDRHAVPLRVIEAVAHVYRPAILQAITSETEAHNLFYGPQ